MGIKNKEGTLGGEQFSPERKIRILWQEMKN